MHIYIYDSYVSDRKYNNVMAKIETRITDLGLNGKIVRITVLNSINEIVENEIKKGASTIVAVGNNIIFNESLNALLKTGSQNQIISTPLGFIPVGKKENDIAIKLGIPFEERACDILSARRIKILDLGKINNQYFLTQASISSSGTILEIDEKYSIELIKPGKITISNLPLDSALNHFNVSAFDNKLELFIQAAQTKNYLSINSSEKSIFSFNKLKIFNKKWPIIIDNGQQITPPATISVSLKKIKLIVNKNFKI